MSEFGELLQHHRHRWRDPTNPGHRLSQEEVSVRLGYGESTYGQWERGRSQPQDRRDLISLIQIFYQGNGIETLAEANKLLQVAGYRELDLTEIQQIAQQWRPPALTQASPPPTPINTAGNAAGAYAADPTVIQVYQRFPTELFSQSISTGHEIRILNTWIPNLNTFIDALIEALQQQARVRILLLYPRSLIAELRNEALETAAKPILKESVQRGVDENLTVLQYIAQHLDAQQAKQLQVRIYHSLPSVSIYQVDQLCLIGLYFHGHLAINAPQFEVNLRSFLGKRLDEEFNTLWAIGQPIASLADWRVELDLLAGKF